MLKSDSEWDVFISHASEDKEKYARPLPKTLKDLGLKVWFDEVEIRLGDSLSRNIDIGLAQSSFGVLLLSPTFFEKGWPQRELAGLVAKEMAFGKSIIPVWCEVGVEDVAKYSPPLADKKAVQLTNVNVGQVAIEICQVAKPDVLQNRLRRIKYQEMISGASAVSVSPKTLQRAPVIHKTLPPEIMVRIKLVWLALREVDGSSYSQMVNNFQRDATPTRELCIWEHIAASYLETKRKSQNWSKKCGKLAFSAILSESLGMDGPAPSMDHSPTDEKCIAIARKAFRKMSGKLLSNNLGQKTELTPEAEKYATGLPYREDFTEYL